VNLIGEHTDYNDGFVLPAAIDRDLCVAMRPRSDPVVEVVSEGREAVSIVVDRFDERAAGWGAYLQGVAWALREAGLPLMGWEGAIASDLPVGAGLSSSAAIELASALAFRLSSGFDWEPLEMARRCRRAENEWVGLASGLMDQLASALGRAGHALLIDCRSVDVSWVPIPEGVDVVVLDTGTRRELESSAYNDRRRECDRAAGALGVGSLRDATAARVEAAGLPEPLGRRARHVVTENARTLAAAEAMRAGDPVALGSLMVASHRSLREDFEVSGEALDAIVDSALEVEGCLGARMTGGGFAGCAIALVERPALRELERAVPISYARRSGRTCEITVCRASDGAAVLPVPPG
jgi:galactokinase